MSYEEVQTTITLEAAGPIAIYTAVAVDSAGKAVAVPLAGTSAAIVGIAQNPAISGEAVTVAISGISKATAGGTVTAAGPVAMGVVDGRLIDLGAARATKYVVGLALSGTTTAGEYFTLLVQPQRTLDIGT